MFETIKWHAFLRVANERKVAKILRRFGEASGHEMVLESCERYWKDTSLFDVRFFTSLQSNSIADAIFRTLGICEKLIPRWTVSAPSTYSDERWEFNGDSMNMAQGIVLIYFSIDNFAHPADEEPCVDTK